MEERECEILLSRKARRLHQLSRFRKVLPDLESVRRPAAASPDLNLGRDLKDEMSVYMQGPGGFMSILPIPENTKINLTTPLHHGVLQRELCHGCEQHIIEEAYPLVPNEPTDG